MPGARSMERMPHIIARALVARALEMISAAARRVAAAAGWRAVAQPAVDVTYVFYAGEEIEAPANGLGHLFRDRPALLAGDAAVVGEPTDGVVEGGCQGTLRLSVTLAGSRAHTARPWMGVNAIHRLGEVLRRAPGAEPGVVRGVEDEVGPVGAVDDLP